MTIAIGNLSWQVWWIISERVQNLRVFPPPPPPPKKKQQETRSQHNSDWSSRRGKYFVWGAAEALLIWRAMKFKRWKRKTKDEKRGKEGRKKKRKLWCVRLSKGESIEERNNCRDFGKELLGKHRSSNVSVSTIAFFFYRGAPWVSKSTHPRKFGNHVTVHRPLPARPSAPHGNQC